MGMKNTRWEKLEDRTFPEIAFFYDEKNDVRKVEVSPTSTYLYYRVWYIMLDISYNYYYSKITLINCYFFLFLLK